MPDGEAALAAVWQQTPDLILSDVMMPRLDGFGLLRELRADPRTAALPVILLSARAGEESRVEGMEAAADDYLVKPFSARELLARVSAHLQMARLRREASESLRASERRFQSFMDHSPTTAYIKDSEGRYVFVNRTLERQFNRTLADWMGKTDLELFPPEEARLIRHNDLSVLDSRETAQFEEVSTRSDGLHHYLSIKFPLRDRDGGWLVAGMSIEITDRKRAEEALRQADRRKDEFLALLAHELRNPLAPLRNGLQVVKLAAGDARTVSQARTMMERQLGHMVRLIDDLLDISRITRNKMELRRSRVLLADVVSSAVETARPAIEQAGHELTVSLLPERMHIDADLTRLAQVFGNLLSNSAKYTPRGGHIWLSAELKGQEVIVSVRDNGIGIPAESLHSIFDMFCQVDRSIERSTGGLGIGLALVKGLVEMHGGTVTAESPGPGKGSTFRVKLPVLKERAESMPELPSDERRCATSRRRRILVVDDNRDSAASMAMMLKLRGDEVRTAHDGIEAVEIADTFRPQVILMDVGMPQLNGLEATRRIRQQPWAKATTIIALTGWGLEGDKERSREAGCDRHLVKPVDIPDLEKLLAETEPTVMPAGPCSE